MVDYLFMQQIKQFKFIRYDTKRAANQQKKLVAFLVGLYFRITDFLTNISSTPFISYTVEENVTLEQIAEYYQVSASDILLYNGISELTVGDEIKIPNSTVTEPLVIQNKVEDEENIEDDLKQEDVEDSLTSNPNQENNSSQNTSTDELGNSSSEENKSEDLNEENSQDNPTE